MDNTPALPAQPRRPLRFHWSLSQVGDSARRAGARDGMSGVPDFAAHVEFCRLAEESGIDSLLVAIGARRPDPFAWATALGRESDRVRFLCAIRSGLSSPTYFVQQVNTVSALLDGRIHLNIVIGHTPRENRFYGDNLDHEQRYDRTGEFWEICTRLWAQRQPVTFEGDYYSVQDARLNTPFVSPDRTSPEIFLGGNSGRAVELAGRHADCLLQLARPPVEHQAVARALAPTGTELGVQVTLIARPDRDRAMKAAADLVAGFGEDSRRVHEEIRRESDSVGSTTTYSLAENHSDWLTPYLWTGAVPYLGAPAIAWVGGPQEIADAIWEYRRAGVTQFLFIGWPDTETLTLFAREVAPLVREREAAELAGSLG